MRAALILLPLLLTACIPDLPGDSFSDCEETPWYTDGDGDSYGDPATEVTQCAAPPNGVQLSGDCDDADADVSPGAVEVCDGIDNNCSGDEEDVEDPPTYYDDADGDGFGDPARPGSGCPPVDDADSGGQVSSSGDDCDDTDALVHPGADETCDGVDTNCSGDESDAADAEQVYADADGDGYGDEATGGMGCPADGMVTNHTDCDDTRAASNPSIADETCNDLSDDNCDGSWSECRPTGTLSAGPAVDSSGLVANIREAGIGDVTGDGVVEIVVGAASADGGEVAIYTGPWSGTAAAPTTVFSGGSAGDYFGSEVAADGDVDGDGTNDVLIGNPESDNGGEAYLFYGGAFAASEDAVDADIKLIAESAGDHLSVGADESYTHPPSLAGDFDGDGNDDILVGAPGRGGSGSAYVLTDAFGTVRMGDATARFDGEDSGDLAGKNVAVLGDVNGDGWVDFAVAAPGRDGGAVYIELGSSTLGGDLSLASASAVWTDYGGAHSAGYSMNALGDLLGDGGADVGLGTSGGYGGWVIDAASAGIQSLDDAELSVSADSVERAGHSIASIDLDHDGHRDMLACGQDVEYIVYGPISAASYGIGDDADAVTGDAGCGVVTGDLDADGFDDMLTVYGYTGGVHVYLGSGE
jgi:hypothetical protein